VQPIANFLPVRGPSGWRAELRPGPNRARHVGARSLEDENRPHGARGEPGQRAERRQEPSSSRYRLGTPRETGPLTEIAASTETTVNGESSTSGFTWGASDTGGFHLGVAISGLERESTALASDPREVGARARDGASLENGSFRASVNRFGALTP
jgi:hypothetical protein